MNTFAIHQAIRASTYPDERIWQTSNDCLDGITDLLRLCASDDKLKAFAQMHAIEPDQLKQILVNYIEKKLLNNESDHSDERILGVDRWADSGKIKTHYQLLMRIFHPDLNHASQASEQAARITSAYQNLSKQLANDEHSESLKNIKLSSVPPHNDYSNRQQQGTLNIREMRSMHYSVIALLLITIVIITSILYVPSSHEIIVKKNISPNVIPRITDQISTNAQDRDFKISKATMKGFSDPLADTSVSNLQDILKNIETYYENGLVLKLKPILANSPEIGVQSDSEIQTKLETLFKITQKRKMLLYDFNWLNVSGTITGNGQFLSRYQLLGEKTWETRKGRATITVLNNRGNLKIIGIKLENYTID